MPGGRAGVEQHLAGRRMAVSGTWLPLTCTCSRSATTGTGRGSRVADGPPIPRRALARSIQRQVRPRVVELRRRAAAIDDERLNVGAPHLPREVTLGDLKQASSVEHARDGRIGRSPASSKRGQRTISPAKAANAWRPGPVAWDARCSISFATSGWPPLATSRRTKQSKGSSRVEPKPLIPDERWRVVRHFSPVRPLNITHVRGTWCPCAPLSLSPSCPYKVLVLSY